MLRHFKIVGFFALFLVVMSLSASADSKNNFNNVIVTGVNGTTVAGSFTFSNGSFSNLSLSFNGGVFAGIDAKNGGGKGTNILGKYLFAWGTQVGKDLVWCSILFDPSTGKYKEWGGISNWQNQGNFNYLSVAEGGNELSYLMLSAIPLFGGLLISGKRRRAVRVTKSS